MKNIIIIIGLFYTTQIVAQNEIDALRYSQQNILSTAKFSSMGGSFGSLGGDFSSLSLNPAGIAFYQNSEITITPRLSIIETNSSLEGSVFNNIVSDMNTSQFGIILNGINNDEEWKRINIGFGWNETAYYNKYLYTEGNNSQSSLADLLLEQANGNIIDNLNSFGAGPAFWSDLIDLENNTVDTLTDWYAYDNGNYISHVIGNSNKMQSERLSSKGQMGEFVFSIGTTFQENIYIGATIGLPTIEYQENSIYSEDQFDDTTYSLNKFTYTEDISAYGEGVNLKLGAIMRIGDNTKIGASIHSPSYISMEEEYATSISTEWQDGQEFRESSPLGYFYYDITTPWKLIGSFSTILNKKFLISADIEQTDYSSTRMYSDYYQFTEENNMINETYTSATNLRFGAEARLNSFNLRAGYGIYGSPFKEYPEYESENYSLGCGINIDNLYIDMGYYISEKRYSHEMYTDENSVPTSVTDESQHFLMTIGYRF